jgi:hypothetical protein
MSRSFIYSDFSGEIVWLMGRVRADFDSLPPDLGDLAEYYLSKRLHIISSQGNRLEDPTLGRPVPYAVFWFGDALGLKMVDVIRKLALSLTYSAIATTIRDDVLDETITMTDKYTRLADYFFDRYLSELNILFNQDSSFWEYHRRSGEEFTEYQRWRSGNFDISEYDPFSEDFLYQNSRYFSAVVLPSLAALCIISGKEEKIPQIIEFLRYFSIGWRMFDDLNDWHLDLASDDFNRSSILLFIKKDLGEQPITEKVVDDYFLDDDFINRACGAMIDNFTRARDSLSGLASKYLDEFMMEQIDFHKKRRDYLLERSRSFFSDLEKILSKSQR